MASKKDKEDLKGFGFLIGGGGKKKQDAEIKRRKKKKKKRKSKSIAERLGF